MFSRTLALAFGFLSAALLYAQPVWKPLDEALTAAQASNRLVLLDLHVFTLASFIFTLAGSGVDPLLLD